MIKDSELLDIYYDRLYPDLKDLDKERESILKRLAAISIIIVFGIFVLIFYGFGNNGESLVYISIGAIMLFLFLTKILTKGYKKRFKKEILSKLITAIDPGLVYNPKQKIDHTFFEISELFDNNFDSYRGSDHVQGNIGKTPIEFSDLLVEKEVRDAKGRSEQITIFNGIFIMTEFNKKFLHTTLVFPDKAEKYLGIVGSWLQSIKPGHHKLVRMDNPAFEKEFVVYADDSIEAHYLLTSNVMEQLLNLKKRANCPISCSFKLNKLFIAIHSGRNWFEPTLFTSLLKVAIFRQYIENINLILGIVNMLNLNTRIWSKL